MGRGKETNFFAFEGEALDFRGPGAELVNDSIVTLGAYRQVFADAPQGAAIGEVSPLYLYCPRSAERIRARLPDMRLVAILRNPIEQAYSHYLYARKEALEPLDDFMAALDAQTDRRKARWQPLFQYVDFARYSVQLRRYFERFPRDQIRIFLYEDFASDPVGVTQQIFRFIGVDGSFVPDVGERATNAGGVPKSEWWQALVMRPNPASKLVGSFLPTQTRRRVRDALSGMNTRRDRMPPAARNRLREDLRSDIVALQSLIERDLRSWLE
jgi:hypothetical protein